jgi:hypothetical protein
MTCISAIATLSLSTQDQHSKAAGFLQQHRGGGGCYMIPQMYDKDIRKNITRKHPALNGGG